MIDVKRIKEVSLLQHDSTDCGAACLASVILYFGGESDINQVRRMSGTSQAGTTMLGLYHAAMECNMEATGYEAAVADIRVYQGVLILHVMPETGYEHYIVSYGFLKGKFVIWDPSKGLSYLDESEVEKIWLSHKCLALKPDEGFQRKQANKRIKYRWLVETIKPEYELLLVSLVIGIMVSALGIVMAIFTQKLLDSILPLGETRLLIVSLAAVSLLLSARVLLDAIRQTLLLSQGRLYNIRVVDRFYRALLRLPKSFFDSRKTGDMVARLNDTMRIQRVISEVVSTYVIDLLVLIIVLAVIFVYSTIAGLISAIAIPFFFLLVHRWNKSVIKSQQELMAGYALNESNFINSLKGIGEIKSMNWHGFFGQRNRIIYGMFQERAVTLGKIRIKLGMLTNLAGILYLICLLLYTSLEVMGARLTQGELMALLSLSSTLLPSVMSLALVSIPLNEAKVAIERMFDFTRLDSENSNSKSEAEISLIDEISLESLSFRYPGQKLLVSDISLKIRKGEIVALVGESGSGKSTLVNIIMRFYQQESGLLKANKIHDAQHLSLERWRKSLGLVPQEVHVFNGTILENIIPEPDEVNLGKLVKIIRDNGLDSFVDSLPTGLATLVGEEGIKLSGGQKQVLAFLRALINEPEMLLIDEGTSGMDRDTEALILNMIIRLKGTIGILLVTHRINIIRRLCDRIYLLEEKKISVAGTHDELLMGDNLYKRYWDEFALTYATS